MSPTAARSTNAAGNISNNTRFRYTRVDLGATARWYDYNDPQNPGIAGAAEISFNPSTCRITGLNLFLNFPHFDPAQGGSNHTVDQKQCTTIHEFGHGLGLSHVSSGASIMLADHRSRCHNQLIKTVQSTDVVRINALY